jgi:anti-anti-sigma factor
MAKNDVSQILRCDRGAVVVQTKPYLLLATSRTPCDAVTATSPSPLFGLFPMPIQSFTKDGILTIQIQDDRLVDPSQITRLFDDIVAALGKSSEDRVVLDFSLLQFMASSALGKLVQLNKKAVEYKAKLKLCGITPQIYEVFKITKLNKVFDIEKDEPTARKSFNKWGLFK